MNHKENYQTVQSTLGLISTKGNDTLIMADCLKFLEQCKQECEQAEKIKGESSLGEPSEAKEG